MVKPLHKYLLLTITLALTMGSAYAQVNESAPADNTVASEKNDATSESGTKSNTGESVGKKIDRAATKTGDAIKKTATKTGRAIKKGATKTGHAIKKGAVKVEQASKKAAHWTGEKVENAGKAIKGTAENSSTD